MSKATAGSTRAGNNIAPPIVDCPVAVIARRVEALWSADRRASELEEQADGAIEILIGTASLTRATSMEGVFFQVALVDDCRRQIVEHDLEGIEQREMLERMSRLLASVAGALSARLDASETDAALRYMPRAYDSLAPFERAWTA
jgi:hypothetical protein